MPKIEFEEEMYISYQDMKGQIKYVGRKYLTFVPFNSKAILLVYKENWKDVTLM